MNQPIGYKGLLVVLALVGKVVILGFVSESISIMAQRNGGNGTEEQGKQHRGIGEMAQRNRRNGTEEHGK